MISVYHFCHCLSFPLIIIITLCIRLMHSFTNKLQVIKSLSDAILSKLINRSDKDVNLGAKVLKEQLDYFIAFIEKSLREDIAVLHTAARDLSFTLAHIYIGNTASYTLNITRTCYTYHIYTA